MSSGVPFTFWFLLGLFAIVQFRSEINQFKASHDQIGMEFMQPKKFI